AALPCLEELYLYVDTASIETLFKAPELTRLRVLQVYFGDKFPLAALANNRALGNLTHLALRPRPLRDRGEGHLLRLAELRALLRSHHLTGLTHLRVQQTDLGDNACEEVISSGILRRLQFLDLSRGAITDDGALSLAECPDVLHLDLFDLSC